MPLTSKLTTKFFTILILLASACFAKADGPQATIESLATHDLLAVGYVDLNSIEADACLAWAVQQKFVSENDALRMSQMTGMVQEMLRQATEAGAEQVLVLIQQEDLKLRSGKPPLFAISVAEGKQVGKVCKSLRRLVGLLRIPDLQLEIYKNSILASSPERIAKAKAATVVERPDFVKAWQTFSGRDAGAMIFASRDTRRVIRELFPDPQAPFENVTRELIADHCDSLGISIDLPETFAGKIVIQTTDSDSAETVKGALEQLKEIMTAEEGEYAALVPAIGVAAIAAVEPEVAGNDVLVDLEPLLNDKVRLASLLGPIQSGSRQSQRANNIRQVMLAMLNYESASGKLPAYANFDADGKPLLSWRVHMLPYLERSDLYKKFKLDEPWDSPHNIQLVESMPAVYADPALDLQPLKRAGKTRIVVPVGKETMFHGPKGLEFKEISDGTSNTIAVVSVTPKHAVVWTQPIDWQVDMNDPHARLFDEDSRLAVVGLADGSSHLLHSDLSVEQLKAWFTKAGGEELLE